MKKKVAEMHEIVVNLWKKVGETLADTFMMQWNTKNVHFLTSSSWSKSSENTIATA